METAQLEKTIVKWNRRFLPNTLEVDSWQAVQPYFEELKERAIQSVDDLISWMLDRSELHAVLDEDVAWRYIKMSINTTNNKLNESYEFFISEIQPNITFFENEFNKKLFSSPYNRELNYKKYFTYIRSVQSQLEIYREKNVTLQSKVEINSKRYNSIIGDMTINVNDKDITLPKAQTYLKNPDRRIRKEVHLKMAKRRIQDASRLQKLFNQLLKERNQIALNAGFKNYRDYKFVECERFDYTPYDCFEYHRSMAEVVTPVVNQFHRERKAKLKLHKLRQWDLDVDVDGLPPLKPFETTEELIAKTITCFRRIRPFFGDIIEKMYAMGHLDLDSKKGKAPGGYNYPLLETGYSFIFMNAVGTLRDLTTMVHEGGHAIHSYLVQDLDLSFFKHYPMEIAELASMSMELISMEHWDVFFENKNDLKRAKKEQLEKLITLLPWIAIIDKFQHWIYEHPYHSVEERNNEWINITNQLGSSIVDWSDMEDVLANQWHSQLHLFTSPFYYIEYGIAQLGAIAVWRNYKQNPEKALDQYVAALKQGNRRTLSKLYRIAGIKFDFSSEYVKELVDFVLAEIKAL